MRTVLLLVALAGRALAQLNGIVDIHTHGDPDIVPRKIDVLEMARLAKAEGMRAVVLKNHYLSTVQAAYLVRQEVPGLDVFGAIALNLSNGGINPAAVDLSAQFKGKYLRIVWMPTLDAENHVRFNKQNRPFVPVAKNGKLLPQVIQVLRLIASNDLVLATGHSSAAEVLLLVREAKRLGVSRIVVTHPLLASINMTIPQMQEVAKLGAYLELCGNSVLPTTTENKLKVEDYVKVIHAIGANRMILSSDLGQPMHPVHTEGWKQFLEILRKAGVTGDEIDLMARRNPATLLRLE